MSRKPTPTLTERDREAHSTANFIRKILTSALGMRGDSSVGMLEVGRTLRVYDFGYDAEGSLRVTIELTPEDALALATMLNREDVREPLCTCRDVSEFVANTGHANECPGRNKFIQKDER